MASSNKKGRNDESVGHNSLGGRLPQPLPLNKKRVMPQRVDSDAISKKKEWQTSSSKVQRNTSPLSKSIISISDNTEDESPNISHNLINSNNKTNELHLYQFTMTIGLIKKSNYQDTYILRGNKIENNNKTDIQILKNDKLYWQYVINGRVVQYTGNLNFIALSTDDAYLYVSI